MKSGGSTTERVTPSFPRPIYANDLVYVSSGFGDGRLFAIDPTGNGNVTESHVRWQTKRNVPKSPSVLVVDDLVFMVDDRGIATCLDAHNGDQVWQKRLGGKFSASPLYSEGHIYLPDEKNKTHVIAAERSFQGIAKNQLDPSARSFASIGVIGSDLLLRSETHLYRIGSK